MRHAFLPLLLGLGQGLLHALGPDHCAALVTLGGRGRKATLWTALRFALAHAVTLGAVSGACLLLGIELSARFERWAELLGGVVLVGVAVAALLFPGALRHGHPHLGSHGPSHRHGRVPMAAGALLAVSGARSLLLAVPPLLIGGGLEWAAWSYLPGFALGIMAGMCAVGLLVAEGFERVGQRTGELLHRGAALATGALGAAWIVAHW